MDSEVENQLNEQLREMAELLSKQNAVLSAQITAMNGAANAAGNQAAASNTAAKADKDAANATTETTKLEEAAAKATEMRRASSAQFATSLNQGKDALISFSHTMLSSTPGFSKYAESVESATDAVSGFVSPFGLIGKAASVLLKVLSSVVGAAFKYSDAVVQGYDDVSKLGGAIGSSAEGITKLAHDAGISSQNLGILTKNAGSLGTGIRALGTSTSGGVEAFGKMLAVGDKNLQQYRKLGYTQEDLAQAQTKYIEQQTKSGADLRKSPEELRKSSLKYVDQLNILSGLTGLSAQKQQDLLDQALAQENFNAYISDMEAQKAKASDPAEKARIQSIIDSKKEYAMFAQQFGPEKAKAILEAISTNGDMVVTESTAMLAIGMPEVYKQVQNLSKGINQTSQLIDANNKSVDRYQKQYGNAGTALGESSRKMMQITGVDNQSREMRARYANMSAADLDKERARLTQQQEAKKNETTGAMADRAKLDSEERNARLSFDDILKDASTKLNSLALSIMPKVNAALEFLAAHMGAIGVIFKGLAIALGIFAGVAGIGKVVQIFRSTIEGFTGLFGAKKGEIGSKNNPLHVRGGAAPSAAGGSGVLDKLSKGVSGAGVTSGTGGSGVLDKLSKGAGGAADKGLELLQKLGQVGGNIIAAVLQGIAQGLASAGKAAPYIVLGAAAIGTAITLIGAGIAGAAWITGKALPSLAEGLKSFDGVNGDNLEKAGKGMAGLGVGLIALGAGKVTDAIGNLFSVFSKESPIQKVGRELREFQSIDLDQTKVENNARSFVVFSEAMASFKGYGSIGAIGAALADGVSKFFGVKLPMEQFEQFAKMSGINPALVKNNALAFKDFASALAEYKGGPGVLDAVSSLIGKGFNKLFGQDGPIEAFSKFSKMNFGPNMEKNADAFSKYANASVAPGGNNGGKGGPSSSAAASSPPATGTKAVASTGTKAVASIGKSSPSATAFSSSNELAAMSSTIGASNAELMTKIGGGNIAQPSAGRASELVSQLNPNSVLMKMSKTPAESASENRAAIEGREKNSSGSGGKKSDLGAITGRHMELTEILKKKLDVVIDVLENSHDTQSKMLNYVRM
jgi:hypothetical protein